jgi:hypothetical protein
MFAKRRIGGRIFCCFGLSRSGTEFFNTISALQMLGSTSAYDRFFWFLRSRA